MTQKLRGPDAPEVATVLEEFGALLRRAGRDDEAAQYETQAAAIRSESSPVGVSIDD